MTEFKYGDIVSIVMPTPPMLEELRFFDDDDSVSEYIIDGAINSAEGELMFLKSCDNGIPLYVLPPNRLRLIERVTCEDLIKMDELF